jgi:hypothetical protein
MMAAGKSMPVCIADRFHKENIVKKYTKAISADAGAGPFIPA